jgi:hypothetical protein
MRRTDALSVGGKGCAAQRGEPSANEGAVDDEVTAAEIVANGDQRVSGTRGVARRAESPLAPLSQWRAAEIVKVLPAKGSAMVAIAPCPRLL